VCDGAKQHPSTPTLIRHKGVRIKQIKKWCNCNSAIKQIFFFYEVTTLEIVVCMQFMVKKYQVSLLCNVCAVAYPGILFGEGVQQIQLRTEDRENGDLGTVAL